MKTTDQVLFRPTFIHFVRDRSSGFDFNHRSEVLPPRLPEPASRVTKFSLQFPTKIDKLAEYQHNENGAYYQLHHEKEIHDRIVSGHLPRTTEQHNHPKLLSSIPWGATTPNLDYNFTAQALEKKTVKSLKNTRAWTADMGKKKPLLTSKKYVKPSEQASEITREVRAAKLSGSWKEYHLQAGATAHHMEDEFRNKRSYKNRYAIEPSRFVSSTRHSGVWELSKLEGKYMWSDTGSFTYHDKGDVTIKTKLDRPNFEGPTLPPESGHYKQKRINLIE